MMWTSGPGLTAKSGPAAPDPGGPTAALTGEAARAVVETLRAGVIEIIARMGGSHFQIGRTYPLESRIDPMAWALLKAVKATLDPERRMNPGALGL